MWHGLGKLPFERFVGCTALAHCCLPLLLTFQVSQGFLTWGARKQPPNHWKLVMMKEVVACVIMSPQSDYACPGKLHSFVCGELHKIMKCNSRFEFVMWGAGGCYCGLLMCLVGKCVAVGFMLLRWCMSR